MSKNALRDTVGFLGVGLSLVFVGWEIRQNTLAAKAAAYQDFGAGIAAYWGDAAFDPEYALLNMMFFEEEAAEFTPEEEARLISGAVSNLRHLEVTWRLIELRLLEPEALEQMGWNSASTPAFATNMGRLWPRIAPLMSPDFRSYFEAQIGITQP